jgi:hypothetical protein
MIEAIAVTLQDEIAAHSFDEPTGERLLACPPMLDRAIASWEANRLERAALARHQVRHEQLPWIGSASLTEH